MPTWTCPMHPQIQQREPGDCPLCGMRLELILQHTTFKDQKIDDAEIVDLRNKFWTSAVISLPLFILAMFVNPFSEFETGWIEFALATPVVLWCGAPFLKKGWNGFINRSMNMFTLISIGVLAAYFFSFYLLIFPEILPDELYNGDKLPLYFESASVIVTLVLLGQLIELQARAKTNLALEKLIQKGAKKAHLVQDILDEEIEIENVRKGDILRVKPGEKIPVDGVIITGRSSLDESIMTGESHFVEKKQGDHIIGGSINQHGTFEMEAEEVGENTFLAHMVELVSNASRSKAPIQRLADQVASIFVPLVLLMAFMTFLGWIFWGPEPVLIYAMTASISVLIIACPCALGLATPLSLKVGLGKGAEEGLLIKNSQALERFAKIKALVIDKTGTLTEGKPALKKIITNKEIDDETLLKLAASLEKASEHPLAEPILKAAQDRQLKLLPVYFFHAVPGYGLKGIIDDHEVILGNVDFLKNEQCFGLSEMQKFTKETTNQTLVYVAKDKQLLGIITFEDPIKLTTKEAIDHIKNKGIKIYLLSGDNIETTQAVAKELGIDSFEGSRGPEYKLKFIHDLQAQGQLVAMAGDGVNDAAALAAADVGISMGTGSDVALESAEVTLVKGDLLGLAKAYSLSKNVIKNIKQNLFLAFIYNIIGIPIAAGILYPFTGQLLSPMLAAVAMTLSSLSVIFNSLRLKH